MEDTREDTREPRNRSRCHRKMLKDVILVFVWKPSYSNHPFALRLHARLSWCQVIIGGEDEFLLLLDSQQMIVYGEGPPQHLLHPPPTYPTPADDCVWREGFLSNPPRGWASHASRCVQTPVGGQRQRLDGCYNDNNIIETPPNNNMSKNNNNKRVALSSCLLRPNFGKLSLRIVKSP